MNDTRIPFTGFTSPDRQAPRLLVCPLSISNCRALITRNIDTIFHSASALLTLAKDTEPVDFELACQIQEAADILLDHAFAVLCLEYVERSLAPEGETVQEIRKSLGL